MTDYIEREAIMRQFAARVRRSNNSDFAEMPTWNQAVQIVEDCPAADVAPVVRCKDCAHRHDDGFCAGRGWYHKSDIGKTVFLSREEAEVALKGADDGA